MMAAEKKEEEEEDEYKMVELKSLSKRDNIHSFALNDSSPAYSNALRRIMLNEVPVLAVEDVEFRRNSSSLYDEMIAHRLGLIPLTTDQKSYEFKNKCKCKGEGCAKCTLKFTLKEKGPKTVYASSLKSADPKVKPVHPKTIIVKLLKDQEIELEATAVLGKGEEHVKWSPCHVYYKSMPEIKIQENKIKDPKTVAESCPAKVFEVKNNKLQVKNIFNCHMCNACVEVSDSSVQVLPSKKDYIFYIESWGQLSPREIVIAGTEILDQKLMELEKAL
ncbi:DNA-directed RNA polymerase subunit D [Candidatus Woesearchaeota archaeon]|nr:DNA-directed RNA polymerase subunit D [Candidatus Woesearchaeota archaeon]